MQQNFGYVAVSVDRRTAPLRAAIAHDMRIFEAKKFSNYHLNALFFVPKPHVDALRVVKAVFYSKIRYASRVLR